MSDFFSLGIITAQGDKGDRNLVWRGLRRRASKAPEEIRKCFLEEAFTGSERISRVCQVEITKGFNNPGHSGQRENMDKGPKVGSWWDPAPSSFTPRNLDSK